MQIVHAGQPFPDSWTFAVFLAGPTPRSADVPSWRPAALAHLESRGFDGVIFVPEPPTGRRSPEYLDQVEWERQGLHFADRIVFWVPRDTATLPGFTTNVEFGRWCTSAKAVLGFPPGAPKTKYLAWLAGVEGVSVHSSLEETLDDALAGWPGAPRRSGGERHVPLHVWNTPAFQGWYRDLTRHGNRLDAAEVLWASPGKGLPFAHVLRARVWVAAESRHKENEWVLSRPDVACVVLYHRPPGAGLLETEVVLVKEFRTPGRSADGFVREPPGGSHPGGEEDPVGLAVAEVEEETGFRIDPARLRPLGCRQGAGTLSSHQIHAFAAELSAEEMGLMRRRAAEGRVYGVGEDSERTAVEVLPLRRLLSESLTDWTAVGVLLQALVDGL
jgi:8-oxo-dGTP pyrophosphatase MutT (NUDIX family)